MTFGGQLCCRVKAKNEGFHDLVATLSHQVKNNTPRGRRTIQVLSHKYKVPVYFSHSYWLISRRTEKGHQENPRGIVFWKKMSDNAS
jgi:hypothetical protein